MRRLEVRFRPEAVADLDSTLLFLVEGGAGEAAERFVLRLRERCVRIGDAPRSGRPRDDLEPGLRTVAFERRAVIAYRVEPGEVRIVNVFYGGRDYEALYRSGGVGDG